MIATETGRKFVDEGTIRFGGFLPNLEFQDDTEPSHKLYLECVFFSRLG